MTPRAGGLLAAAASALLAAGCGGSHDDTAQAAGDVTYRVPSESMAPTYGVGDEVAVDLRPASVRVGDVVTFHPPVHADEGQCGSAPSAPSGQMCPRSARTADRREVFIKRVVAVGGDTVALRGGRLVRDGRPVREPFARGCTDAEARCDLPRPTTVPRGTVVLLGDDRANSDDSRFWGPVDRRWVLGKVVGVKRHHR